MVECIIIRYDEISIKSKIIKKKFEKIIIKQIKKIINKNCSIKSVNSRILIKGKNLKKYIQDISLIFGLSSVSLANEIKLDLEIMKIEGLKLYKKLKKTFRVSCQRIDKGSKFSSQNINEEVGYFIVKNTNAPVSLKNYDTNICFEIFNKHAYIFSKKIKGYGGLPVGSQGSVIFLGKDINACIMMMKRGCHPIIVGEKKVYNQLSKKFKFLNLTFFKNLKEVNYEYFGIVLDDWKNFRIDRKKYDVAIFYPLLGK